jgi:hypothetical protein
MRFLLVLSSLIVLAKVNLAQSKIEKKQVRVIQFSGVVVTGDSLLPVPFAYVLVKGTHRGTVADGYGFFSFAALEKDTVVFSALGYHNSRFIIPDSLIQNKYNIIHVLSQDTILLKEAIIYPFPTREQFKQAFLKLNIKDDEMERARKNLQTMLGSNMYKYKDDYAISPESAFKNYANSRNTYIFQKGIMPGLPITGFARFINAMENGELKNMQVKEDNTIYKDK